MRNKVIAFSLVLALVLSLCISGSLAYSAGSPASPSDIIALSTGSISDQTIALNLWVENGYEMANYFYYFSVNYWEYHGVTYPTVLCSSCSSEFVVYNNQFYALEPRATFSFNTISWNMVDTGVHTLYSSSTPTLVSGLELYSFSDFYLFDFSTFFTNATVWTNFTLKLWPSETVVSDHNLLASFYEPDQRQLTAYNAWFNGEDFIQVEVSDDIFANYAFVTVHGYDSTYETPFYHTFRFDDFLQKGYDDGLSWFKLNPRMIPWENFYLDSLEYVSSGSFGSKTVSLPDLNYGYDPMDPDPLVNEYHYYSTSEVHYTTESPSRYIYSMTNSLLRLNENFFPVLFCDDQLRCAQDFNYSTIFLPYCLTDLQIDFEEFFIECVNYYDLVVLDVDETCFDLLYGAGSYDEIANHLMTTPSYFLASWYKNHYSTAKHLGYVTGGSDPTFQLTTTNSCHVTFYFTTSWFFKQVNFLLGDTGDVLTELSSRLFDVDGFADKLLGNMAAWASDQTDFYNVLLPKLTPIISFCNDMTLGDYFNKIVDRLDTIVNNFDIPIELPIDDDVAAIANAFVEFWTKMFQGASPYATAFASTLQSLVSSDPQVFSLPEDPNNIALPVFPSPSVPLLPTLTPTPVPIGG